MFIDQVEITVEAGSGGKGAATFRREKYVPRGGPSGGDGGRGGSVVLQVDANLSTLLDLHYRRHFRAGDGQDGQPKKRAGRDGHDVIIPVPPGTIVTDLETGNVLADLVHDGEKVIVARGGAGGRGNLHFTTPVHQAPHFAELGEPGEKKRLRLDLKLVADVGILGYPSVGKSTLISAVSAARPRIGDYPFTTLVPHLGLVRMGPSESFVLADMPGLIEGAHAGAGLGDRFLRHVERTRLLIHMLDCSGMTGREPYQDFCNLQWELALHSPGLAARPQIVALNKMDICADLETVERLEEALRRDGWEVYRISAATHMGVWELMHAAWRRLQALPKEPGDADCASASDVPVLIRGPVADDSRTWTVSRQESGTWVVSGRGLERLVLRTDLHNEEAVKRLQHTLERAGVHQKLRDMGAVDGDTVRIGDAEFEFWDEDLRGPELGRRRRKGEPGS